MKTLKSTIDDVLNAHSSIVEKVHRAGFTLDDISQEYLVEMIYQELERSDLYD